MENCFNSATKLQEACGARRPLLALGDGRAVMKKETRYQRVAREQAERQEARAKRMRAQEKREAQIVRARRRMLRRRDQERAYENWATSDFPNQEGN